MSPPKPPGAPAGRERWSQRVTANSNALDCSPSRARLKAAKDKLRALYRRLRRH